MQTVRRTVRRTIPVRKLRSGDRVEVDGYGTGTVVVVREHDTEHGPRLSLRVALDDVTRTKTGEVVLSDLPPSRAITAAVDGVP